jgi:hypothetical protein
MLFDVSAAPKTKSGPDLQGVADSSEPERPPKHGFYLLLLLLVIGAVFLAYHLSSSSKKSPIVVDEVGNASLAPDRQKKLDKELEEIDNAVQYALIATDNKEYPCYTCPDGAGTIFLYIGEVWKYGVTRKGEKRRYPKGDYGTRDVRFEVQFEGTTTECLKMEKIKIYNYPILPEARKRDILLAIPPGNGNDN